MPEYMLLVRNEFDHDAIWPPEKRHQFLEACERYIAGLNAAEKLISAQPLAREGRMISGSAGAWKDGPFHEAPEIIVGYYHILAADIDEAVAVAKENPEFAYGRTARVEVRPVKTKEQQTGYVYPRTTNKS